MHPLAVMHRWTLCENVDSAKINVPFYTTDINILRVASMHRIIIHRIDISIHIDESLHPYSVYVIFNAKMTLLEMSLLWAKVRGRVRLGLGQIM